MSVRRTRKARWGKQFMPNRVAHGIHKGLLTSLLSVTAVGLATFVLAPKMAEAAPKKKPAAKPKKKPDYKAAKEHFRKAEQASQAENWDEAVREFLIAYEITQDPVVFFKLATAYQSAGKCSEAVEYFKRYNEEANPSMEYRADALKRITDCNIKLAGEPATGPGEPATGPGEPATGPGEPTTGLGEPATGLGESSPDEDDTKSPMDPLDEEEKEELVESTYDDQPTFIDEEITWQKTAGWTSVGVSAAFLTAGAVLGLSAKSREEDLDNLLTFRDGADRPTSFNDTVSKRYNDLEDEGKTLNTMSMVAFGLAGASAATAIAFFLLDDSPSESSEGMSHLTPTIGEDSVGVRAGWTF